jgi:hypothetical protein
MSDDLDGQVAEADQRARHGRIERLKILQNDLPHEEFPVPALALAYYEEARLCWYMGAFVATVLMVQLAFEELLRSYYRVVRGVGGKLSSGVLVDRAGFGDLIKEARPDDFLTDSEARDLDSLKNCRNLYVHTKDEKQGRPSFFDQLAKIAVPELVGIGAEDEARVAVKLLITFFPTLCMRQM